MKRQMMLNLSDFSRNEPLSLTTSFTLCRAFSKSLQRTVIIKSAVDIQSERSHALLLHEYALIRSLGVNGLLIPLNKQTIDQHPILIFENVTANSLATTQPGLKCDTLMLLNIAKNLAVTLSEIHAAGVIHKRVAPQNILFNPESAQTYLSNFTAASNLRDTTQVHTELTIPKEGLSYMSPELTGWMNRAVDFRTDLYSLGVTLYQIATDRLPFEAVDPMELIHAHIACPPVDPCSINPQLDPTVASIILKLLRKTAEDRYQTAFELSKDLNNCLEQKMRSGRITPFKLGKSDIYGRLQIPHRLYGRKQQVEALMASFERTRMGETELMLVAGYSGIGKSALINEVRKPIIERRGYFISGKFDQLQRDIPCSAIILAFQDLVRQLLMLDEEKLNQWRQRIQATLADKGAVIIEMVPQIELIIGPQPPVVSLGAEETLNRFNMIMGRFIHLFATADHPLTIFIDDLQWADSATLNFIKSLTSSNEYHHLLLLGAYRDNEVNPQHPFSLVMEEIRQSQANVSEITLGPLSQKHLTTMLSDILCTKPNRVAELVQLLKEKTDGNPFFVIQFLLTLYDEKLIYIDSKAHQWQWDMDMICTHELADNVLDLMAKKVRKLPNDTQELLKLAACIGTKFKLSTVAIIANKTLTYTAKALWPAVNEGLLQTLGDEHKLLVNIAPQQHDTPSQIEGVDKFLHDRVQQAAYELIAETDSPPIHLNIGRELLKNIPVELIDENIFEIVPHLNKGIALITAPKDRADLANLNLSAALKAKRSSAWKAALHYADTGLSALTPIENKSDKLYLKLQYEKVDCHFRNGQFTEGASLYRALIDQALTDEEKLALYNIAINNFATHPEYMDAAINTGLDSLKLLGMTLEKNPSPSDIALVFDEFDTLMSRHSPEEILDFPKMNDKRAYLLVETLVSLGPPTFISGSPLYIIVNMQILFLIAQYGNCDKSSYCFGTQGVIHTISGRYKYAYQFSNLVMNAYEKYPNPIIKGSVYTLANNFGSQWGDHPRKSCEIRSLGFKHAIENGELHWGVYSYIYGFSNELMISKTADELIRKYNELLKLGPKFHHLDHLAISLQRNVILKLQDKFEGTGLLSSELKEEKEISAKYGINLSVVYSMHLCQAIIHLIFRNYDQVLLIASKKECSGWQAAHKGMYGTVLFTFIETISILQSKQSTPQKIVENKYQTSLNKNIQQFKAWANVSPINYQSMWLIIKAEIARSDKLVYESYKLYEQAIQLCSETGFILLEAVANELCAYLWQEQKNTKLFEFYLTNSRDCYQTWGAYAKVDSINHVLGTDNIANPKGTPSNKVVSESEVIHPHELDLATVIKTSQSTFSEIDLNTLLDNLIRNIIENTAAQKGGVLLDNRGELQVAAYSSGSDNHEERIDYRLTRQVFRTGSSIVIDNASDVTELAHDKYIQRYKPKSVLCTPIRYKGEIKGVLYLENNLTTGVFDSNRITLLDVLLSQAATAIENSKLFDTKRELEAQMQHSQKLESLGVLAGGIAHDFNNLLGTILGYSDLAIEELDSDAEVTLYLKSIISAATHASTLTNQMLAYAGRGEFKIQLMEMNSMIHDLGHLLTSSVSRQVTINYHLAVDLPKFPADISQVQQIIMNLVTNAADAIKQHGDGNGAINITTYVGDYDSTYLLNTYLRDTLPAGQYVCLTVEDSGCGMNQATINKIFDPFFTTKPDGRGLGMAAILGIVRGHKGAITISSELGIGTTFKVLFPSQKGKSDD